MEYKTEEVKEPTTPSAEQFDSQDFFRKHLVKSEDGSLSVQGEDLSPVELALLETEKRRRGSQAASSREKARADKLDLEINKVKTNIREVKPTTPVVDESLKYTDPDAYIEQTLAARQHDPYQEVFDTASEQATAEFGQMTVENVITQHNQTHPDKQITKEMLEVDLPPRLVKEFSSGNLHPSEFLRQAADILYRPTEPANPTIPVTPNLGEVGGQTTPTDDGSNDKLMTNYANAVI